MENPPESPSNGIAIIGMAGRFPGAGDVESFWANLVEGVETLSFFSPEELAAVGVEPELLSDPAFVRARGVIDGAELFDAAFFDISPREAEVIDPQQRLLLEHAWEALENAGYDPRRFPGAIGMYAGAGINTYLLSNLQRNPEVMGAAGSYQAMLGSGADFLATRVSFKLGLRGPSLTVQTACSTSLVAVHLAVQSLLAGECDMALAGGVRLLVPRKGGHLYQPGNIFSKDGHCRPFDAAAAGTTDGEGAGLVVLRRLEDALADGDHVHAVILGSAINNDGSSKMAYTVPSVEGQAEVIATAQALAGVDAGTIGMIEAHGTGTPLGDPIEVAALSRVFAHATNAEEPGEPCALGSLKSNMGHLDAAAGIASLIKATLAVERGLIPPSLHFERPNPQIDFAATPFYVPVAATPWQPAGPRRAGVSSFGIGGTNAHVVLEQAPPLGPVEAEAELHRLLVLSARTPAALEEMSGNLAGHLRRHPDLALADVAHTLQVGRAELDHRRAVVVESLGDAAEVLASLDPKRVLTRSRPAGERQVFFLFPGQGSQHPGMAAALYRHEPVFRRELLRAAEILQPRLGLDLLEVIDPAAEDLPAAAERLKQTALAQPALFAVEHALARLWMSWGVRPAAMLGHSVGEYVAACLAGVFSLEDALALVTERGRLMQEMPGGAMLAVSLAEEEVRPLLGGLALAAVNGPLTCVVSGAAAEVEALSATLAGRGVEVRALHTSHAFHSPSMEPMLPRFAAAFEGVRLHPPAIPFVSNLTGTWIEPAAATSPDYWVRHLRETVRFSAGLETLFARAGGVFLEVGPGRALSSLARQHPRRPGASPVLASLPAAADEGAGRDADAALLRALGQAWLAGVEIDWAGVDGEGRGRRVALPTYPFERRRYWVEPAAGDEPRRRVAADGVADWLWVPLWRQALPTAEILWPDEETGSWLLFADPGGLGDPLAAQLREHGREVVEVRSGDRFAEDSGGGFTLRPGEAADYGALFDRLAGRGALPARIVHLWSTGVLPAGGGIEGARREMERGFWSLLHLARALGDRRPAGERPPLHLGIVASGVQRITGAEALVPARATLLGPALNLPQEYPGITVSVIDVDLPAVGSRREGLLVDRLLDELAAGGEPVVAYRGGERWLQGFASLPFAGSPGVLPLREGGTCLITGGLGGVGLELAALLAGLTRAKLVLAGRAPFPGREEWPALAAGGGQGRAARVARRLLDIEALGGEVLTVAADVTDAAAMRLALAEARRRFGRIEGVIHAAGLPGGGLMQWRPIEEMAAVLAPKVQGTLVLAELLAEDAPDFLVLCSSLNALAGGPGQADYTAANAFLDAFAQSCSGDLPVVSINWGAWREVGMAARTGQPETAEPEVLDLRPFPHLLLGMRGVAADGAVVFVARLHPRESWILDEHRLGGQPVLPGTAYLEMARAAFRGLAPEAGAIEIRGVQFLTPLRVGEGEARDCYVVLHPIGDGFHRFMVQSREGGDWQEHVTGEVGATPAAPAVTIDVASFYGWDEETLGEAYLEDLKQAGMGPRWEVLKKVYRREGEVVALLEIAPGFAGEVEALELHPALLDVATGFAQEYVPKTPGYYLPLSYKRLLLWETLPARAYSHARLHAGSAARETLTFDISVLDAAGNERVRIEEYTIKRVDVAAALRGHPRQEVRAALPGGEAEGMAPEQAAEAFRRILSGVHLPQVAVSVRPLPELLEEARSVTVEGLVGAGHAEAGSGHTRPDLETPYVAPSGELEERLAAIWADVLGLDRVGVADDFFELGGHSLLGIQMVSRVREALGVEVPLGQLFEVSTVADFASLVAAQLAPPAAVPIDPPAEPLTELPTEPPAVAVRQGWLPLSFAQERFWFLDRLAGGSAVYNMPLSLRLEGILDVPGLAAALREIVRRHEVLRTTFALPDGGSEPVQVIGVPPSSAAILPLIDLAGLGAAAEGEARRLAAADARQPFDLARGPLIRPLLLRMGGQEHMFLGTMHHTVSDGWSMGILVRELAALYPACRERRRSPLAELPMQYADYALWQRKWLSGPVLAGELAWWGSRLAGLPASLSLPTDRPRPAVQSLRGARRRVELGAPLVAPLAALARGEGATLFMVLLGAFAVVLARAAGETDLAVGTPIAGRNRVEAEGLIGTFVNSLVLRADLAGDPDFRELLARMREATLAAYAHQDMPFERLVAELAPERNLAWSPLFQVMFVLQNAPLPPLELPGLTLESIEVDSGTTKFDLTLSLFEAGDGLEGAFEYSSELFDDTTIARLAEDFAALLGAIGAGRAPGVPLSALTTLAGPVRQQILVEWNDTAALPATAGLCLHELFEGWAVRTPDAPAVLSGDGPLSYADLDRLAEGLAGRLRRLGRLQSAAESRVGVSATPSGLRVAALLAVHKAGGAYVPLDPELPPARLGLLAADAGLAALLVEGSLRDRLAAAVPGLPLVEIEAGGDAEAAERGGRGADPDSLAYVVYTSGSTGTPNGVPVAHRSVVNLIDEARRELRITPESRVLHHSSLSFDAAALEIFVALTSGAALVVGSPEGTLPGVRLAEFLRRHAVSVAVTTPAVLALLPEAELPALRTVTVGGESCPPELAARWAARGRLVNCYGPTETTIYSTSWRCRPPFGHVLPIGRPVANTQAFVLDSRLEPVPPGVPGELCLGGAGLARGYLGRPELSARRFVPHPYPPVPGARLYRTGDLARFLPGAGGALEFLGRADAQVKVRGLRIEPGEIEAVLVGHPRVREALVAAVAEAAGGSRLVAFLVLAEAAPSGHGEEGEAAVLALELRDRVMARLPAYMVPSQLVPLDALPLTPHGKVDRRALARLVPAAGSWGAATEYVEPQTPLEEMLAGIWIELLGIERAGAHDSFFSLGGHSLQGIRLMSRIADEFGVELPVKALFEAPTLAALAERIGEEMSRLLGDEEEQLLAVGESR